MKRLYLALILLVLATWPAHAQSPVTVIGPITANDCVKFNSTTIITDAGFICTGQGILPNATVPGTILYYNGSAWVIFAGNTNGNNCLGENSSGVPQWEACSGSVRVVLTNTTTFYVNADGSGSHPCGAFTCSAGSDSNTGLSNSSPWQTIQHSVATMAANYDFAGQTVNLQAADGTYTECVALPSYITTATVDKNVFILGHNGLPLSVSVTCTSGSGNTFTAVNSPQGWVLKNLDVTASNNCLVADYHSAIYWDGGNFASCGGSDVAVENTGAFVEFVNHNYTTASSVSCHVNAVDGGEVTWQAVTATMSSTPTYSVARLCTFNGGYFDDKLVTFSGAFSGPAYAVSGRTLSFSTGSTSSTSNSTQYIGASTISNSENNFYVIPSIANKAIDFYVNAGTAPGAGQSFVFTLRIGGSATPLTCTIGGAINSSCNDTLNATTSVAAGTVVDVQVVSSSGAATAIMSAGVTLQ